MRLFDYRCLRGNCATLFEELAEGPEDMKPCPTCGTPAKSIISPVRSSLPGTDPGFPDAYDRWARIHEDEARRANKRKAEGVDKA